MRIGLFTDTYPPFINGVSTSILILKESLEKQGHTVYVLTINTDNFRYETDSNVVRIPGVPVGIYDYRVSSIYPIRLINKIKKWNLDIIHSHTEFSVGTFARIIAKQLNIPLVHTYHTMWEDYTHYITKGHFDKPSKKIVEYITKFYCDKTITELIVPTKKTYDLFKEKYKVERNVHIVPTGINLEKFHINKNNFKTNKIRKELGITDTNKVVLFLGRLAKEKNIEFLLETHKDLIKNDKEYKLIIVGDGPDKKTYLDYVLKNKLENNILFTGKVSLEEVPNYYQLADVFSTASRSETQGLTVIEAMASGVIPVCINDDSFTNVVNNEFNGFIFKNKKEYKNIITKIFKDKTLLTRIATQAKTSSKEYSSSYFASRVLDVYKTAVESKKSKKNIVNTIVEVFKKDK